MESLRFSRHWEFFQRCEDSLQYPKGIKGDRFECRRSSNLGAVAEVTLLDTRGRRLGDGAADYDRLLKSVRADAECVNDFETPSWFI